MDQPGGDPMAEVVGHLERALQDKSERLASLVRTTTAIVSSDDLDSVLQVVGFEVARFMSFDRIAVAVIEWPRNIYRIVASASRDSTSGASPGDGRWQAFPLADSAVLSVVTTRNPYVRRRLDGERSFPEEEQLAYEGMRSCALVPMIGREGVVGVLILASREEQDYSGDNLSFLELIAEQFTGALERQKHLSELKKRHGKLAIIDEISRKAMAQFDMVDVLDSVTSSIHHYFGYYDASVFLVDDSAGDVVLMAQAGAYRELTTVGYRQKIGVGLVGACVATGQTILVNDASQEPRRVIAFPGEAAMGSELCTAIKAGDNVLGVINVECRETDAFDEEDVSALEAFAAQIAQTIENARLYEETRLLKEFNENIIANMPTALVVTDTDMRVQIVNETYCKLRGKSKDELVGRDITEMFSTWFLREGGLAETIRSVLDTGEPASMPNVKGVIPPVVDRLFNLHVSSVGLSTQQCSKTSRRPWSTPTSSRCSGRSTRRCRRPST